MTFDDIATAVAHAVGHPLALAAAAAGCAAGFWVFGIDITNIGISVASLFLLFIIQRSQNQDGVAIQVKLDELIRATDAARNSFIAVDRKPESEIEALRED